MGELNSVPGGASRDIDSTTDVSRRTLVKATLATFAATGPHAAIGTGLAAPASASQDFVADPGPATHYYGATRAHPFAKVPAPTTSGNVEAPHADFRLFEKPNGSNYNGNNPAIPFSAYHNGQPVASWSPAAAEWIPIEALQFRQSADRKWNILQTANLQPSQELARWPRETASGHFAVTQGRMNEPLRGDAIVAGAIVVAPLEVSLRNTTDQPMLIMDSTRLGSFYVRMSRESRWRLDFETATWRDLQVHCNRGTTATREATYGPVWEHTTAWIEPGETYTARASATLGNSNTTYNRDGIDLLLAGSTCVYLTGHVG